MERCTNLGLLILDRQVEFKLSWKLILRVQSVGEIHPPYPTVSMNLRGGNRADVKKRKRNIAPNSYYRETGKTQRFLMCALTCTRSVSV